MHKTTSEKLLETGYTKHFHPIDSIGYVAALHQEAEGIYNSDNVQMNQWARPHTGR